MQSAVMFVWAVGRQVQRAGENTAKDKVITGNQSCDIK